MLDNRSALSPRGRSREPIVFFRISLAQETKHGFSTIFHPELYFHILSQMNSRLISIAYSVCIYQVRS